MNREELAELRRVVEAMTPGRYEVRSNDSGLAIYGDGPIVACAMVGIAPDVGDVMIMTPEDAAGIVALRNAAKDLLAAAEEAARLLAELAEVRAAAVEACDLADLISDGVNVSTFDDRIAEIRARIGGGP